jgi:2-polyprenyl-3-methyl-5-hydroxy-6-metoxy-1,4-benzoquinol methylase
MRISNATGQCPGCGSRRNVSWRGSGDFVICTQCNHVFRRLLPDPLDIERTHSEVYSRERGILTGGMESPDIALENHARFLRSRFPSAGTVLDYGAGSGAFAQLLTKHGFRVHGVELSREARRMARERRGFTFDDQLECITGGSKFDLITLLEVIEHLPDPVRVLRDLREFASNGGGVYITTPNRKGLSCLVAGANWKEALKDYHLSLFDSKVLSELLKKAGWKDIEVLRFGPLTTNSVTKTMQHRMLQILGWYGGLRILAYR